MQKPITITPRTCDDGSGGNWIEYICGSVTMNIENGDFEFTSLGHGSEGLRDLHTLLSHPDIQRLMFPEGSPEAARAAVIAALNNPRRMPSAAETFNLLTEDRVSSWLWWRAVDWTLYRVAQGRAPEPRSETSTRTADKFDAYLMKTLKGLDWYKPMDKLATWYMKLMPSRERKVA